MDYVVYCTIICQPAQIEWGGETMMKVYVCLGGDCFLHLVLNGDWHTSVFFVYPALHLDLLVTFIIIINSEPRHLTTSQKVQSKEFCNMYLITRADRLHSIS